MNLDLIIVGTSLVLQVLATLLAIRLFWLPGRRGVALIILTLIFLMTFRRGITLYHLIIGDMAKVDLLAEFVALVVSLFFLIGFLYVARLIGSVKKVTESLVESERRYHSLFDNSPDGILLIDDKGGIIDFNETAHRQLGYSKEEFTGLKLSDIDATESPEEIQANIKKVIEEGKAEFEVMHKTKSGDIRNVRVATKLIDLSGRRMFHTVWRDITEETRVQEALRESERFLNTMIEMAPTCIKLIGRDGTLQRMNRTGLSMIQADSLDQVRGQSVYTLVSEEYRSAFKALNEDVFRGKAGKLEFKMTGLEGRPLWLFTHTVPLRNEKEEIVSQLAITVDITDRKQMEEALLLGEARLRHAQQIAHVGDWEWEITSGRVHWSDELYRIYGYAPGEISPDYALVVQAMHPRSKGIFLDAIDAALKGEKPFEMDYIFFRRDGSEAVLHTIGQVVRNNGAPERMIGIVQDITKQKYAEDALRYSEEKFRSIFDYANDGILIADISTKRFMEANKTICVMTGYTREEIVGLGVYDIHPEAELPWVVTEFEKQMRGEKTIAEELPIKRKDGTIFYADVCAASMILGGKAYAVGIFRDITEQKHAKERMIAALTEKEILLKEIHHRVKNNLQIVASMLRLQTGQIKDSEARILFEESRNRVQTMSLIHERLYRSENLARIDFREYVTELIANIFALAPGNSPQIERQIDIEKISLDIDHAILCGLIINELVSNCLRHAFTEGQKGTVAISMRRSDEGRNVLVVRDDGRGLPEGADIGETKSLGLQLVSSLTKQLGGTIEIQRNGGAAIKITFQTRDTSGGPVFGK